MRMAFDDPTAQAQLTPEARRELLRAFADRMLLKVAAMDDPEDLPGVERAVRVAAVIERLYSRCDRAERQIRDRTPDPRKLEAERAANESEAIKAQVSLANTLKWGDERRQGLGHWWDDAENLTRTPAQAPSPAPDRPQKPAAPEPQGAWKSVSLPPVTYVDLTDDIEAARAELALKRREAKLAPIPPPGHPPLNSG